MKLATALLLMGLIATNNVSARVRAVYVDKGLIGPRIPEAGQLAEPFLEHKLAAYLTEALQARRIRVIESTDDLSPKAFGPDTLYVSLSYSRIPEGTDKPNKYRGYAVYVSQRDPLFDKSLACSWQVAHALSSAGEKPWSARLGTAPTPLDPTGVRAYDSLTAPSFVKGPSVFLEAGVMVSEDEIARLAEPATLRKMADAIVHGIDDCAL
jgi:N-acetylmuramoyl-L-alanine amidase